MMKNYRVIFTTISLLTILWCCETTPTVSLNTEIEVLQEKLATANEHLKAAETRTESIVLAHTVLFQLKADADTALFIQTLKGLATIKYTRNLMVAVPEDTGDARLATDYDVALHMDFVNLEDLAAYQQDSTHLAVRAAVGPFVAARPVVYDFAPR